MDALVPLIDGDILVHEIAAIGDFVDEEGNPQIHSFNYLSEIMDIRILEICEAVNSPYEPIIYLSGKDNFRYKIATTKPYKGNRKKEKPTHFLNLKWYLISRYGAQVVDGMEADDALGIYQTSCIPRCPVGGELVYHPDICDTVICSRDKDLRQIPGWHYGWEIGLQPEYKLQFVSPLGSLTPIYKESMSEKTGKPLKSFKKLIGNGYLFFCAQVLIGDETDNIPGLSGCGPKRAYELLCECKDETEALQAVIKEYKEVYGDEWEPKLTEQAQLVWIGREINKDGSLKMWELPKYEE